MDSKKSMEYVMKRKAKILLVLMISFFSLFAFTDKASAEGSIGVTGTFSSYDYKIVQGETIDTPLLYIAFVNNYDYEVQLRLSQDTPDGVTIHLDEEIVTIAPNSNVKIPIVISAAQDAIPGEYDIYVRGRLIQEIVEGRINVGSEYALMTTITIFGEAADLEIDVVDIVGEPIRADMNLYQVTDGNMAPLAYSGNGQIAERVIPGKYTVFAFWDGYQLVKHEFEVATDEHYKKTLVAETVQIYGFFATPVFMEGSDTQLATANITFVLHNIYKQLNNARVVLVVYKDEEVLERRDIFLYDTLEVNRHELGLNYVPAQGWDKAVYKFVIEFYVDEHDENGEITNSTLYASSLPAYLDVSGLTFKKITAIFQSRILLLFILAGVIIGLFLLFKYLIGRAGNAGAGDAVKPIIPASKQTCPDCGGKGTIECPVCEGRGKTPYGNIEEECVYCDGLGEVMCAACINPKHLIVCPKCEGEKQVMINGQLHDCTYCNGLGSVVSRQYSKYIDGVRMKLGKKKR